MQTGTKDKLSFVTNATFALMSEGLTDVENHVLNSVEL